MYIKLGGKNGQGNIKISCIFTSVFSFLSSMGLSWSYKKIPSLGYTAFYDLALPKASTGLFFFFFLTVEMKELYLEANPASPPP